MRINRRAASVGIARAFPRGNQRAASIGIARAAPNKRSHGLAVAAALLGCILMGCSTDSSSDSSPAPPASSSTRPPSIPSDGATLAELGFLDGPIQHFSLPRTAIVTAKVDQPNNVAVVVSTPSPTEIANYLRRALPAAGFTDHCRQSSGEHHDLRRSRLERQFHRRQWRVRDSAAATVTRLVSATRFEAGSLLRAELPTQSGRMS